jgi:hypothetical protein
MPSTTRRPSADVVAAAAAAQHHSGAARVRHHAGRRTALGGEAAVSFRPRVLALGLLLLSSACIHRRAPVDAAAARDEAIRLDVTNHYTLPMEIYAIGSGITHRLGIVNPGMAAHFIVPQALVGRMEFEARVGQNLPDLARSGELVVMPGHVVEFVINNPLFSSTAQIR